MLDILIIFYEYSGKKFGNSSNHGYLVSPGYDAPRRCLICSDAEHRNETIIFPSGYDALRRNPILFRRRASEQELINYLYRTDMRRILMIRIPAAITMTTGDI